MKEILFFLIFFLGGCHTPKEVVILTPPKTTVDTALISKPLSIEPILDTTSLRITVVHNPKYPNRYGVELANRVPFTNQDTVALIHLQKVILGTVVKYYSTPCPPETEAQRGNREDFDLCVIHDSPAARFELRIPDPVPFPLKCAVYYSLNGDRKVNYCFKVDTTKCIISYSRGNYSEPGAECIWEIGMGN
jgi:hypothetical protein